MVSPKPAPVERPHNWSKRGRILVEPNEPGVTSMVDTVPDVVEPSGFPADPNTDYGTSSQQVDTIGPSEETDRRLCEESVTPINARITEYEGNVGAYAARLQALEDNVSILPDTVAILGTIQDCLVEVEGRPTTNAERLKKNDDLNLNLTTLRRDVNGILKKIGEQSRATSLPITRMRSKRKMKMKLKNTNKYNPLIEFPTTHYYANLQSEGDPGRDPVAETISNPHPDEYFVNRRTPNNINPLVKT